MSSKHSNLQLRKKSIWFEHNNKDASISSDNKFQFESPTRNRQSLQNVINISKYIMINYVTAADEKNKNKKNLERKNNRRKLHCDSCVQH